jgi:hypothetical protein
MVSTMIDTMIDGRLQLRDGLWVRISMIRLRGGALEPQASSGKTSEASEPDGSGRPDDARGNGPAPRDISRSPLLERTRRLATTRHGGPSALA